MKNFKSLFNFSCHPGHKHLLSVHDINLNLIRAEYAVRGFIPTKA